MPNSKKKKVTKPSRATKTTKVTPKKLETKPKAAKTAPSKTKTTDKTPGKNLTTTKMPALGLETEEKSLYEYAIGIKNITVAANRFQESAAYVSQVMSLEGNVREVTLETVEEHPDFDAVGETVNGRRTSIEYSIAMVENPGREDWHPILPKGESVVRCERLFVTGGAARLRFAAEPLSVVVYKDGVRVSELSYVLADKGREIRIEKADTRGLYTVDYRPTREGQDPWRIEVSQAGSRKKQVDRFPGGTNHNKTIVLSKYPYVDYAYINGKTDYDPNTDEYRPFEVFLKNANIAGPERTTFKEVRPSQYGDVASTLNRSLYKEDKWNELKKYSLTEPYLKFEYYTWKNRVVLSETFNRANVFNTDFDNKEFSSGNAEVEVHYEYLATDFRLKAVLRRNSRETDMVSPFLHEYRLHFKTEK